MPTPTTTPTSAPLPTITEIVAIGESGIRVQWAFCIIFILTSISVAIHSTYVHQKARIFHLITTLLTAVLALTHYAMVTGSGSMLITFAVEPDRVIMRQIFYIRFLAWYVAGPLILLSPALLSGLAWVDTFTMLIMVELGITSGLMAALLTDSSTMLGWYGFQALFCICLLYILVVKARHAASKQPGHITSLYNYICLLISTIVIIILALLVLGDGTGKVSVNTQAIALSFCDFGLCVFIPVVLIIVYQRKVDEEGHGPNAIPEHFYEHREHGWEGGVRLEG